jgi:uncharacterized membrane protein YbhN (UPF0104 family)
VSDSISAFGDAVVAFGDRLGDTHPLPLVAALAFHTLSLIVRARVWRGILRSAFPGRALGAADAFWAYAAGVGANALAPMRGGDVVRVYAVRRLIPGASVATIVATLLAESIFGLVVVAALAAWAVSSGGLPPLVQLPDAKAFEFSYYAAHPVLVAAAALALIVAGLVLLRLAERRARELSAHIAAGFRVIRPARRFLRIVAAPQVVDWIIRGATAYSLLAAFGIHASVRAAILVLVVDSVATAIPFTPGGAGAQQALLAFALGATASQSQILAFSVGNQAVITLANIALGIVALVRVFGHLDLRRLRREAAG